MHRFAAALLLPLLALPAAALPTEARSASLSLDGSFDSYGGSDSDWLRAGAEFELYSGQADAGAAFDWSVETYYDYYRSANDGEVSEANSLGLHLAKVKLSRWKGRDLEGAPYLLLGAEYTRLRESGEGGRTTSRYLSPAVGLGAEFKLTEKVSFKAEYRQNLAGGDRRIAGLTLGFAYELFGKAGE